MLWLRAASYFSSLSGWWVPRMENLSPVPVSLESQNAYLAPAIRCWTSQLLRYAITWDRSLRAILCSYPAREGPHTTSHRASHSILPSTQGRPFITTIFSDWETESLRKHQSVVHNLFIWCEVWFLGHHATADPDPKPPFRYYLALQWGNIMPVELMWQPYHLEFEGILKIRSITQWRKLNFLSGLHMVVT